MISDKNKEQNRYNQSSKNKLSSLSKGQLKTIGAKNFPPYLQSPYIFYKKLLKKSYKFKHQSNGSLLWGWYPFY